MKQDLPRRGRKLRRLKNAISDSIRVVAKGGACGQLPPPLKTLSIGPKPTVTPPSHPEDPCVALDADYQATSPSQVLRAAKTLAEKKLRRGRTSHDQCHLLLWARDPEVYQMSAFALEGVAQGIVAAGLADVGPEGDAPFEAIHVFPISSRGEARVQSLFRNGSAIRTAWNGSADRL